MKNQDTIKPLLLFVIADSSRTGAPKQVLALMKGVISAYQVHLACPTGWLSDEAKKSGIQVHELPGTRLRGIKALKKIYQDVQPGLVHVHGVRGGGLALAAAQKNIFRTMPPFLYTEHTWTEDFPMASRLRKALHLFALRKLMKKTTKVIAVSQAVQHFFVNHHIVPASNIQVIYGGIEPGVAVEPVNEPMVGFLGHLSRVKGVHLLLQALALLSPKYPKLRCKIGGMGNELFSFQYLAHKLKIDQMVEWVGEVRDPHVFFEQIRILVQPSLSEAFGLSALEAMSCGIPVIVSRAGGLKEIVEDSENSLTFPRGEVAVLASQMELLLNDQPLYERLSQKGRERAAFFTVERMVQAHLEMYRQVLSV